MSEIVHHVAFALAALALGAGALRVAGRVAPDGLERALVAVVLAVVAAIVTALALGLAGLGTNPVVLTAAAVAMWAAARALVPRPAVAASTELALWWGRLGTPLKLAVGALCGVFAAWLAWQLRFPSIGFDSAVYHYPDVAGWIANGRPGSQLELSYEIPYGNYPLTDEVGQTWGAAIARSYIPLALWNPAMLVVAGAATWLTLRNLRVSTAVTALTTATLLATPLLVRQLNEPQNDLPALAWLACCAAFATGAGRRPALMVPALLAAGLGIGTKATVAPARAGRPDRRRLPGAGPAAPTVALAGAGPGGCVRGGRVLVRAQHRPARIAAMAVRGLPVGHTEPALPRLSGPDLPFAATGHPRRAPGRVRLAPGWGVADAGRQPGRAALPARCSRCTSRARGARWWCPRCSASAATLIWSVSWGSGMQTSPELATPAGWSISALRYLLPGIALAILSVALATRLAGLPGRLATLLLAAALIWSIAADAGFGSPWTPSLSLIAAGAAAGALVAAIAIALGRTGARRPAGLPSGAAAVAAAVVLGALMAPVARGFIERSTDVSGSTQPVPEVVAWFLNRPGFEDEDYPVSISSRAVMSAFAGDRFQHALELVPAQADCRTVRQLARSRPLVVTRTEWFRGIIGVEPYPAPRCVAGSERYGGLTSRSTTRF